MTGAASSMRARLRADLTGAIKARDPVVVAALRSALAAIDDAEAVEPGPTGPARASHPTVAGAVGGVGAADVRRRELTRADLLERVEAEITDRLTAAREYDGHGLDARAARLRAEAAVLSRYLDEPGGRDAPSRECDVFPGTSDE